MIRLTTWDWHRWLSDRGLECEEPRVLPRGPGAYVLELLLPQRSRALAVLAHWLVECLRGKGDMLLLVTQTGVWPTEEMPVFVQRAMMGYGDPRPIADARGFLFNQQEIEGTIDLARVGLISGWDFSLVVNSTELGFNASHDEWLSIFGTEVSVGEWLRELPFANEMKVLCEGQLGE